MEESDYKKGASRDSTRLNVIASLLFDVKQSLGDKMSVREKVDYLLKRGIVEDDDLSSILGITRSHASKEKALVRKEQKNE